MKTAAKKRNSRASGVIALMLVLASALVFASSATASSASHLGPKTRAEVSGPFSLKSIERSERNPINSSRIYDSLDEVALECTVAPVRPLANIFSGHGAGQGFTGVFDSVTGKVLLRPSTADNVIPTGWVARRGGHDAVSTLLGGNRANHAGYAAILQADGTLAITWRSGVLNRTADNLVPLALRQQIVDAIQAATGRIVSSF
jgi:hypothetical protein